MLQWPRAANRKNTCKLGKQLQFDNTRDANAQHNQTKKNGVFICFLFAWVFWNCSALSSLGHRRIARYKLTIRTLSELRDIKFTQYIKSLILIKTHNSYFYPSQFWLFLRILRYKLTIASYKVRIAWRTRNCELKIASFSQFWLYNAQLHVYIMQLWEQSNNFEIELLLPFWFFIQWRKRASMQTCMNHFCLCINIYFFIHTMKLMEPKIL